MASVVRFTPRPPSGAGAAASVAPRMTTKSTKAIAADEPMLHQRKPCLYMKSATVSVRVQRAAVAARHHVRLGEELEVADRRREADEEERRREQRHVMSRNRCQGPAPSRRAAS